MSMFCYQCQEAAGGKGCTLKGVCGKDDQLAGLMDVLIYVTKGIAVINSEMKNCSADTSKADHFILDALFSTITNANFDKEAIKERITKGLKLRDELLKETESCPVDFDEYPQVSVRLTPGQYESFAPSVGVLKVENEDIRSLKELVMYGLKGLAAYAHHVQKRCFQPAETVVVTLYRWFVECKCFRIALFCQTVDYRAAGVRKSHHLGTFIEGLAGSIVDGLSYDLHFEVRFYQYYLRVTARHQQAEKREFRRIERHILFLNKMSQHVSLQVVYIY